MILSKRSVHFQLLIAGVFWATLLVVSASQAAAQDHSAHSSDQGHEGMSMAMDEQMQMDAPDPARLLAEKKESEFNHHFAGLLVLLAGVFILVKDKLNQRWPYSQFAWPFCFLLSGLYLLVFSDTELWPFGPQSWWYGLSHNPEDVQHKTFAVILLALGILEVQRARGVLKSAWTGWVFPALAFCGSVMLLFHEHQGGMHGADHMAVMARIQAEHRHFAVAGFGIGALKGLSEFPTRWQATLAKLWSIPMIALGVLLMLYAE
jgi:copper resistance protein D